MQKSCIQAIQYLLCIWVCANIFGAIVLTLGVVVMIIWSIVIIINFVLTLQVSTASLSHDRKPCEIKVVFNHTCSLHSCVCAGSRRRRIRLSGFRRQGIATLLRVSQVALFRSGSVPNIYHERYINYIYISRSCKADPRLSLLFSKTSTYQ